MCHYNSKIQTKYSNGLFFLEFFCLCWGFRKDLSIHMTPFQHQICINIGNFDKIEAWIVISEAIKIFLVWKSEKVCTIICSIVFKVIINLLVSGQRVITQFTWNTSTFKKFWVQQWCMGNCSTHIRDSSYMRGDATHV